MLLHRRPRPESGECRETRHAHDPDADARTVARGFRKVGSEHWPLTTSFYAAVAWLTELMIWGRRTLRLKVSNRWTSTPKPASSLRWLASQRPRDICRALRGVCRPFPEPARYSVPLRE